FILFKRKKLNLSEHSIIAGMILLGILLLSLLGILLFYFNLIVDFSDTSVPGIISTFIIALTFLYIVYGYFNAFASDYSKLGITYRILLFFVLLFIEIYLILIIIVGFVTN